MSIFLATIGDSLYYNDVLFEYFHRQTHKYYGKINSSFRIQEDNSNSITLLKGAATTHKLGIIFCAQSLLHNINFLCKNPSQSTNIHSQAYTSTTLYGCTIHIYIAEHFQPISNTLSHKADLWLYPLGFDIQSATILIQPFAKKHTVKIIPIHITSAHYAFIIQAQEHALMHFTQDIIENFKNKFFLTYDIIESIQHIMKHKKQTVSIAESCTGGLIASYITAHSGSSNIFHGSVVSYHNTIKKEWLKVSKEYLEKYGAVSEVVVKSMLEGILCLSHSDYAIASTGIAGPNRDGINTVGTVFLAIGSKNGLMSIEKLQFHGDRIYIQQQAALYALNMLLCVLLEDDYI